MFFFAHIASFVFIKYEYRVIQVKKDKFMWTNENTTYKAKPNI